MNNLNDEINGLAQVDLKDISLIMEKLDKIDLKMQEIKSLIDKNEKLVNEKTSNEGNLNS